MRKLLLLVLILFSVSAFAVDLAAPGSAVSLNAATATGAGTTVVLKADSKGNFPKQFTWTVVITGTPTASTVNLEGSIDGTNWFTLDTSTATTSEMRHVTNKPVGQIRCNDATLTGGSTPTVTCVIGAF